MVPSFWGQSWILIILDGINKLQNCTILVHSWWSLLRTVCLRWYCMFWRALTDRKSTDSTNEEIGVRILMTYSAIYIGCISLWLHFRAHVVRQRRMWPTRGIGRSLRILKQASYNRTRVAGKLTNFIAYYVTRREFRRRTNDSRVLMGLRSWRRRAGEIGFLKGFSPQKRRVGWVVAVSGGCWEHGSIWLRELNYPIKSLGDEVLGQGRYRYCAHIDEIPSIYWTRSVTCAAW